MSSVLSASPGNMGLLFLSFLLDFMTQLLLEDGSLRSVMPTGNRNSQTSKGAAGSLATSRGCSCVRHKLQWHVREGSVTCRPQLCNKRETSCKI